MSSGRVEAELAPEGAFCAVHPESAARFVCTRCGSYACETCSTPTQRGLLCRACLELVKAEQPQHLGEASTLQRVANLFIDVWVGAVAFMVVLAVLLGLLGVEDAFEGPIKSRVMGWAIVFTYYVTCESLFGGRSLGKLITGTRVLSADGALPSFRQIVKRSAIRLIPFDGFSFLGSSRGWHDRWSGTRVVRTRGKKQWDADEPLR